jgi:capsular exopolysaccharide synthesis family protein
MTLNDYLRICRRWWWLVLGGCAAAFVLALLFTSMMQPVYRTHAVILVNQNQGTGGTTYQDILSSQQLTKTYAELAKSDTNLTRAVQQLNIPGLTVELLEQKLSANAVRDTQLIHIHAEDSDPQRAALIANTVASLFPSSIEQAQQVDAATGRAPAATLFVARTARVPLDPVRPSPAVNAALGVFLGFVLMCGVVAVLEYRDDGINDRDDVQALGVPFLGALVKGEAPSGVDRATWIPIAHTEAADLALAESCRQVQAAFTFAQSTNDAKVILITSSTPGEGKSTTAANLAATLAESSKRVLIIDGDLRKPDVHRHFSLPQHAGFTTAFLMNDREALPSLLKRIYKSLYVMTAGPRPPNPAELLGSRKAAAIIDELKAPFDVVLIDSPPLLGLADASLLLGSADGVVLVARSGKTRRKQLEEAIDVVRSSQKPLIGVVLNGASRKSAENTYGYGFVPKRTGLRRWRAF